MTLRPPAIFGVGRNYADHAQEMGAAPPDGLMIFMKNPASVIGDGDAIRIPAICAEHGPQVDFEGELCIEIGRDCRDISADDAVDFIRGYRAANDVSARWWQKEGAGGQFCRGKGFDTFCPISELVPTRVLGDASAVTVRTTLSGELMQDGNTSQMIWPVRQIVSQLSRGTTIIAGTLILTGTPAGVGAGRKPPRLLRGGDEVRVEIGTRANATSSVISVASVTNRVIDG